MRKYKHKNKTEQSEYDYDTVYPPEKMILLKGIRRGKIRYEINRLKELINNIKNDDTN